MAKNDVQGLGLEGHSGEASSRLSLIFYGFKAFKGGGSESTLQGGGFKGLKGSDLKGGGEGGG